jgi:ferredoxin
VRTVARRLTSTTAVSAAASAWKSATRAITLVDDKAAVDQSRCILCGYCAAVCPEYVIRVV